MKRINACLLLALFSLQSAYNAQEPGFEWAKQIGSPGNKTAGSKITTDKSGNVYTLGTFSGTADFDPGPGTFTLDAGTLTSTFILKLDSTGNFLWAKNLNMTGTGLTADKDGNVLTMGTFTGSVDADPGPGVFAVGSSTNGLSTLILKLDNGGNFVWGKAFLGSNFFYDYGYCAGNSISLDAAQNIYFAGSFYYQVDFDPGPGTHYLTSLEYFDNHAATSGVYLPVFFLCKLDSAGNFSFVTSGNPYSFHPGFCIVNAPGESMSCYEQDGAYYDEQNIFFEKRATNGSLIWKKQITSSNTSNIRVQAGAVDHNGNYWIAGQFSGTIDFDPGTGTYYLGTPGETITLPFILELDSAGNLKGVTRFDKPDASSVAVTQILTDTEGSCYLGGSFTGTIDFDLGPAVNNLNSVNGSGFILKLNPYSYFKWVTQIGENATTNLFAMNLDNFGNIYTAGSFTGTVDFDPGPGSYNLTAFGSQDAFMHKLSGQLITGINEQALNNDVRIFPNPTNAMVYLRVVNNLNRGLCRLMDMSGKIVKEKSGINGSSFDMDLSEQANGLYILEISDAKTIARIKLVKD